MIRAWVVALLLGVAMVAGCEPPPEAGEGPIGVMLRPLAACNGGGSLDDIESLRFVVQAPEGADDLLTTVVDEEHSLGDGEDIALSGIPVGERRQLTVLGYKGASTEGKPDLFGRAKHLQIVKDQKTDVSLFLSTYGGYGCLPGNVELTRRVFPAIVPLDDGRLFVAGGFTTAAADGAATKLAGAAASVFIYDPNANTFEKVNSNMQVARGAFAGAFLKSRRWVVLVGGASELRLDPAKDMPLDVQVDKGGLNTFEVFDLQTNSFLATQKGAPNVMSMKRVFPRVAVMQDDTVHVYGGGAMPVTQSGSGGTGYDQVDIYGADLDADRGGAFRAVAALSTPALEMIEDRSGLSVSFIEVTEENLSTFLVWGGSSGKTLGEVYTASSLEKDGIQGAFLKVTISGDTPPMTYFHEMARLGQGRFLLTGGLRKDGAVSGDDAYLIDLADLATATSEVKASVKRVEGLGVGRFLHAAVGTDTTHAVVFGGFTDRSFTPTGDKRLFSFDGKDLSSSKLEIPAGEEDFSAMGAVLGLALDSDAIFVFAGVASFVDELLAAAPKKQDVYVYAPSSLIETAL